ncbi:MAG: bifunctional phosphoribosylaminoimidazolecarboxamide formyltransferase/IMP cyclohydrolase [Bacteroidia bacterium]|nr:bifunctional phosphoribosylaminoimidazolecarboxamide formyltransferase/IMP cyclohydrolase [Bacteroidia bacterium]NNC86521.1 bifunctional phosphoribosylaminoimidazolecarboxamide formyltransferase/IMP cyclohydrolase [Bacteroidia bacterium]NNM15112.1 bifunctional phosphoribosylaminoimidazolecarboxamide formyltransferase/IMP cyclohydrolase [Bacteroidia bacterium]
MHAKVMVKSALISVFNKENLSPIIKALKELNIQIYATGGTKEFILEQGAAVIPVEEITDYPSILGGRVKTLHPKIFGGILGRRENKDDLMQLQEYDIPQIDIVIVDLYPFEQTVKDSNSHEDIIEKIDIGGISLIRAAAKNYKDVLIIPSRNDYGFLLNLLKSKKGVTTLEDRKEMAAKAFAISSNYDSMINDYLSTKEPPSHFSKNLMNQKSLRYGENPHQKGAYYGNLEDVFVQLHGKELSYNNLLDIDAALSLVKEFDEGVLAIFKHNNACGIANAERSLLDAWNRALAADPVSVFGGVIATNKTMDIDTASAINELFVEIVLAPEYDEEALKILKSKKNRILLQTNDFEFEKWQYRSVLNGVLYQEHDSINVNEINFATDNKPSDTEFDDLLFANKIVKQSKSNAIVIVKNKQLIASGVGQTSRVDSLNQAIEKAKRFELNLEGAVMASDAFFPFPDCVEIASHAGIKAVIQPGGSINDQKSLDFCNKNGVSMVLTGIRHFKH